MSIQTSRWYLGLGCGLAAGAWELAGRRGMLGDTFPALSQILSIYADPPRRALLLRSAAATASSAAAGYTAGVSLGAAAAMLAYLLPWLRPGLDRTAVLANALPIIALAPVLIIVLGREGTPAALAAIPVFFLIYSAAGAGLRTAGVGLDAVLTVLGANRWQRLVHLQAIAALPWMLSGMKIASGSAMIGAIVGEWFGARSGLGVVVINSMQNFQIALLWATVIVIAATTAVCYGLLSLAERRAVKMIGECAV